MSIEPLTDSHGRNITYLRISVTDRCNLRCVYCAPTTIFKWIPHENILRFEEIDRLVRMLCLMGIKKIRITGGEPLVRKGVASMIEGFCCLDGLEKICLTTNGVYLKKYAKRLYDAGLKHVNISLDSLDRERYRAITRRDCLDSVLDSLDEVLSLGFHPIKLNCVVLKGINDRDLVELARLSLDKPFQVRFIEFMPIGEKSSWTSDKFMSSDDTKSLIEKELGPMKPVPEAISRGPAKVFKLSGAVGEIGFISPLSHHFCGTCNRIRLTADGKIRLCLFSDQEWDVLPLLRKNVSDSELEDFLRHAVKSKPMGHMGESSHVPSCKKNMSSIGG